LLLFIEIIGKMLCYIVESERERDVRDKCRKNFTAFIENVHAWQIPFLSPFKKSKNKYLQTRLRPASNICQIGNFYFNVTTFIPPLRLPRIKSVSIFSKDRLL